MFYSEKRKKYLKSRPVLITSNSSWYLYHYRKLLIRKLKKKTKYLIALTPTDKHSEYLSKSLLHIPLRISRKNDFNLIYLIFSLIKMILIVRAIKPKLIHSHTLKANLISSITASFYGVPCILSFTGMGNLSKTTGFKKGLFFIVLKIINLTSQFQRNSRWSFKKNHSRVFFIYQNPRDLNTFSKYLNPFNRNNKLILGSGIPTEYLIKDLDLEWSKDKISKNYYEKINCIYCARLLRSKGITDFIDLATKFEKINFNVYGDIDLFNDDSLTDIEISKYVKEIKNLKFNGLKKNPLLNQKSKLPILFFPSNYGEGFPRSILEALALKIPVICTQNAASEVFSEDLLYISDNNMRSYISTFQKLLEDYKTRKISVKIEKAYKFVKHNLTEEHIVNKTLEIYSKLDNFI